MFLWGNKTKNHGFTLVELLVVISIIAILAVVGITVFSGVQKSARDAKRKADINAIANALEVNKTSSGYKNPANHGDWFSSGNIPYDPKVSSLSTKVSGCGDSLATDGWGNQCWYCEYSPARNSGICGAADQFLATTSLAGPYIPDNAASWTICANLEGSNPNYYCKSNQQ